MIISLDHIAVAVADLDGAIARWTTELGLALDGAEDVPSQQTRTAFVAIPATGAHVELVTPMDGKGPIAAALAKRGPGLHHLCFRSDDLDGDVARLKAKGWQFTTDAPTPGAHGKRVIFVHPKSTGGVLVELSEGPT
jgi:methylmalonyl-CoA/ethylmalonyl-CoA epimerase